MLFCANKSDIYLLLLKVKDVVAVHYQPFRGDPTEYMKDIPEAERQTEDLSGRAISQHFLQKLLVANSPVILQFSGSRSVCTVSGSIWIPA